MEVELVFGVASTVILLGVASSFLSKRFGLPDVPVLILLGLVIGPVSGLIDVGSLSQITPIFTALAISILLFEGGSRLRVSRVAAQAGRAALLALGSFVLSTVSVGFAAAFLLGLPLFIGLILGAALGGTSSVVVYSLLARAGTSQKVGALLSVEAAITTVFAIIVSSSLAQAVISSPGAAASAVAQGIFRAFSVGLMVGVVGGFVWLKVLDLLSDEPYSDIATVGYLLGTYALAQSIGGSGALATLAIGLIVGNGTDMRHLFSMGEGRAPEGISRRFHEQISFTLRTFFFVYLGLLLNLADPTLFIVGGLFSVLIVGSRYAAVLSSTAEDPILRMDSWIMTALYPRGLAAAVMAQTFLQMGLPFAGEIVDLTVSVILWTVISSSVVVSIFPTRLSFNLRGLRAPAAPKVPSPAGPPVGDPRTWFRSSVKNAVLSGRPGVGSDMGLTQVDFGGFMPLVAFGNGKRAALFDAVMGFEEVKKIPFKVKACQEAHLAGQLSLLIDEETVQNSLPRLLLVERYCDRASYLGFKVRIFLYQPADGQMVPVRQIKEVKPSSVITGDPRPRSPGIGDLPPRGL